jgi:hypothetical protein
VERSKSWVCLGVTGFDATNLGLPAAMNHHKEKSLGAYYGKRFEMLPTVTIDCASEK